METSKWQMFAEQLTSRSVLLEVLEVFYIFCDDADNWQTTIINWENKYLGAIVNLKCISPKKMRSWWDTEFMGAMAKYIFIASILGAVNNNISIAPIMGAIIWIAPARHEIGRDRYKKRYCYLGAIATPPCTITWVEEIPPSNRL